MTAEVDTALIRASTPPAHDSEIFEPSADASASA